MTQPSLFDDDGQMSFGDIYKDYLTHGVPGNEPLRSPGGTPVAPEHAEFEAIPINEPETGDFNPLHLPAPLTLIPTSTLNPQRPRTVAAGYNYKTRTLTVIFRHQGRDDDDQPYNYYDVDGRDWTNFKSAYSKGRYILVHLDSHDRGFADSTTLTPFMVASFAAIAAQQQALGGLQPGQTAKAQARKAAEPLSGYRRGNLGGTGRARNQNQALAAAQTAYAANRGRFNR